jgi:hypothetical protein
MTVVSSGKEPSHQRFLFDFYIHESESINMRADWFLIFHAILFEAFAAAKAEPFLRMALGALGCLASYIWLMVGIRQCWDIQHLTRAVITNEKVMDPETAEYFRRLFFVDRAIHQRNYMKWARAIPAFCIILPGALLLTWLVLVALSPQLTCMGVAAALLSIMVATVFWRKLGAGPRVPPQAMLADPGTPATGAADSLRRDAPADVDREARHSQESQEPRDIKPTS